MAYNLGAVKPHVAAAANELGTRYNIRTVYGYRRIGSVPNSDHPKGLALDFMTSSKLIGDALAADAVANSSRLGITYVIWYGRIWTESQGWHGYVGPSPHTDHVHMSFDEKVGIGDVIPVGIPGPGDIAEIAANVRALIGVARDLARVAAWLNNPDNWTRIALFSAGSVLVFMSVVRWDNAVSTVASGVKKVTSA